MAMLTVQQGAIEEELFVPESTKVGGFAELINEWPHKSKFTFSTEPDDRTMLNIDGMAYPWQTLLEMEDTPLSVIFNGATKCVLELPIPPVAAAVAAAAAAETLSVVSASDGELEALSVATGITISELQELLSASYTGDLEASLIQFRGFVPTSFVSIKLSTISDKSVGLMDYVSSRISSIPEVLRPSVPAGLSELRLKLAIGAMPKVVALPPQPDGAEQDLQRAEAKMLTYAKKGQTAANKLPEDGTKLMYVGGELAMKDYEAPPAGKEKDKSSKEGSINCTLCSSRFLIANGGTTRHLFGETHLKKWVNAEGGDLDELRSSLNPKLTSGQKGEDSRTKRSTQYKVSLEKTAHKAARTAAAAVLATGATGSPMPAMPAMPAPAMAALAGSPAAAAAIQAALNGEVPGAGRGGQ